MPVSRRRLIAAGTAMVCAPSLAFARTAPKPIRVSTVAGPGRVPTLEQALAIAAAQPAARLILLDPGIYDEKLTVTVPGVTIAAARPGVILTHAAGAAQAKPDGSGNWGTSGSATLTIAAPDVTLSGLTIRNAHPFLAAPMQAVALAVGREGDRCRLLGCTIEGWQDTLLIQARTLVDRCRISGCVDFIFGGGAAWIGRSTIVSRHVPGAMGGFIVAPSTPAVQPYGLVLADCRITREPGVPDGSIWLGRPWRAGGNMALTGFAAFVRCWMDAHVAPTGWTSMGYRGPDGEARVLTPGEARLFEADNHGPGARSDAARRQLAMGTMAAMTQAAVLGGWHPTTKTGSEA